MVPALFGLRNTPKLKKRTPHASEAPPGEAEKVVRVRDLCERAKVSATNIIRLSGADDASEERDQSERDRYFKLTLEATNIARSIKHDFYRDAALSFLIDLLMAAGDHAQAKKLFHAIEYEMVYDALVKDHPALDDGRRLRSSPFFLVRLWQRRLLHFVVARTTRIAAGVTRRHRQVG